MTMTATIQRPFTGYATGMVTRIRKGTPRRVFLREWRKHKGLDAVALAGRLGIERESYYRLEREPHRLNLGELAELAEALGIEPESLWRLPTNPSLDAEVAGASQEDRERAIGMIRLLMGRAS